MLAWEQELEKHEWQKMNYPQIEASFDLGDRTGGLPRNFLCVLYPKVVLAMVKRKSRRKAVPGLSPGAS